jgi:hypothetical protein
MPEERHYLEELANVVEGYPLWPGDTISHETARVCGERGWIVRQEDGSWIPTAEGLAKLESVRGEGGG